MKKLTIVSYVKNCVESIWKKTITKIELKIPFFSLFETKLFLVEWKYILQTLKGTDRGPKQFLTLLLVDATAATPSCHSQLSFIPSRKTSTKPATNQAMNECGECAANVRAKFCGKYSKKTANVSFTYGQGDFK